MVGTTAESLLSTQTLEMETDEEWKTTHIFIPSRNFHCMVGVFGGSSVAILSQDLTSHKKSTIFSPRRFGNFVGEAKIRILEVEGMTG